MYMNYDSKAYALVNREDKRHVQEVLHYLSPQGKDKVLEIGCGRGFIVKKIQEICPQTYGVDINPNSIENSVAKNLQEMDAQQLAFESESFDKVYSFHTIEHVPDPRKMLAEIERILKPGGKVLLVYPAEPIRGLFSIPAAIVLFKNPFRAREIHLHKLNPKRIQEFLLNSKLKYVQSKFALFSSPQYFTVLQKQNNGV